MKKYVLSVLAVMLCSGPVLANVETRVLIGERGNKIAYKVSVPDAYAANRNDYPVAVHLHGHGGQGSDPRSMGGTFGSLWKERFIGIFPQCLKGQSWWHPAMLDQVMAVLNHEKTKLRMDGNRIYVTGQSMGGYGSYQMAIRFPRYFAAVAPVCGAWGPYKKFRMHDNLSPWAHIPFWAFHGDKDHIAPFADGKKTVDRLRAAGIYTRFTVYPRAGHNIKGKVYSNPQFFEWLLAQKRGTPNNFELGVGDGKSTKILGYFEPRTVRKITARAPDTAKKEVFTGWTSAGGTVVKNTTTNPSKSKGRFANAKALTTTFTMPANDVIVTANYTVATAAQAPRQAAQADKKTTATPPVGLNVLKLLDAIAKKTKFLTPEFMYYQPKGMDPVKEMPLLFWLHGISGRGNDIKPWAQQWKRRPPGWFQYLEKHQMAAVFPQCALGNTDRSIAGKKGDGWWQPADLNLLLEHLASTYNIDRDRIYLTGFSMGSFGAWAWAIESPQTFAAVVPIAGGGDPNRVGVLRNVPIWVFHGDKDTRVPPDRSQVMVDALKKAGSTKVKFTLQPNTGHSASAWGKAELYEWFLSHSRSKKPSPRISKPKATTRPRPKPTSGPKRTDEDRARSQLALAKAYIGAGLKAKATAALKQLITKYPKTQAAKTAAAELEKLPKQ